MRLPGILAAGLLLAGCASLVDLSGYTFVADDTGESGGSAGASGAGGGGASCSSLDPVDEGYVRACALAIACTSGEDPPSLARCVEGDELPLFSNAGCIRTKSDCDGYFQCTGERGVAPASCGPQGWTCEEDRATGCGPGIGLRLDCKLYGGKCRPSSQQPSLSFGLIYPCELPGQVSCQGDQDKLTCSGDFSYQCAQGTAFGRSCASVGQCLAGGCVISGTSCDAPGTSRCVGSKRIACAKEGREQITDCAQAGLVCTEAQGQASCVAPGCQAQEVASCQDRCDGSKAVLCLGGAPYAFDCASIGGTCTEKSHGKNKVACSIFLSRTRAERILLRGR